MLANFVGRGQQVNAAHCDRMVNELFVEELGEWVGTLFVLQEDRLDFEMLPALLVEGSQYGSTRGFAVDIGLPCQTWLDAPPAAARAAHEAKE